MLSLFCILFFNWNKFIYLVTSLQKLVSAIIVGCRCRPVSLSLNLAGYVKWICKCLLKNIETHVLHWIHTHTCTHNHFTALFPGPPRWAGARRELLDFMVQGKINRSRHTDHPSGRHSNPSWLTSAHLHYPLPPFFYRPDALPAVQPTVSKHWMFRQTIAKRDK